MKLQSLFTLQPLLRERLRPTFTLIGSVTEGTKICLGNELDIVVSFEEWKSRPPFRIHPNDPFHLRPSDACPTWLRGRYFDDTEQFELSLFKADFLESVHAAVQVVFSQEVKEARLKAPASNVQCECRFRAKSMSEPLQLPCSQCPRAVTQTKIGACIQLVWKERTYCSMDLVPVFNIEALDSLKLAKIVNNGMVREPRPTNWHG